MPDATRTGGGSSAGQPPQMDSSRRTLLALFLMLGAMWFWKSRTEEAAESPLAYSQLFAWAQQGKIESVVISGDVVDGTLKKAESLDGKAVQTFHCDLQSSLLQDFPPNTVLERFVQF